LKRIENSSGYILRVQAMQFDTESIQMKDKIKQNGGTVWFLMAKDEGHGFRKKKQC